MLASHGYGQGAIASYGYGGVGVTAVVPMDLFNPQILSLKETGQIKNLKESGQIKSLKRKGQIKWVQ